MKIGTNCDNISTNCDNISANCDNIGTNCDNIGINCDNISTSHHIYRKIVVESRSWRDRNLKFGPNCDLISSLNK